MVGCVRDNRRPENPGVRGETGEDGLPAGELETDRAGTEENDDEDGEEGEESEDERVPEKLAARGDLDGDVARRRRKGR